MVPANLIEGPLARFPVLPDPGRRSASGPARPPVGAGGTRGLDSAGMVREHESWRVGTHDAGC